MRTVNGVIAKWKYLGTTANSPQSGGPHKDVEQGG